MEYVPHTKLNGVSPEIPKNFYIITNFKKLKSNLEEKDFVISPHDVKYFGEKVADVILLGDGYGFLVPNDDSWFEAYINGKIEL